MLSDMNSYGHFDTLMAADICDAKLTHKLYICISDSMQAINSDIYYNMAAKEIDATLLNEKSNGHDAIVEAARSCGLGN